MLSVQGLSEFPANKAKIDFTVNGTPYSVLALQGDETVSGGFTFHCQILTDLQFPLQALIGCNGRLVFRGQDGIERTVIGVVTKIHEAGWFDDRRIRVQVTLESALAKLKLALDTRIILGHTAPDIIKLTCARHGILGENIQFDLSRTYPIRPYTLQANETDWQFVCRLAANNGIYFYSIANEHDQEVIVFVDHNAHSPYIAREVLHFIPDSGQTSTFAGAKQVGLFHLSANARQVIPQARVHDFNEETPSTQLLATSQLQPLTQTKLTPAPGETKFGQGTHTLDESDAHAKLMLERARVMGFDLDAKGNVVDMAAGHICSIDAQLFGPDYSGDYFIVSVQHEVTQFAGHNDGDSDVAYRHMATYIKRETPFRSELISHPAMPMTLSARIESDGPYARLDEQGKYQLRTLFDTSTTAHTQASIPIRRLTPYGGHPSASNVGWHTPLQDGAEVLISCLNGDPDRPVIVGTVPNPEKTSSVTSQNPSQNRLRTLSDNELTFDDTREAEAIILRTYEGYNILHLDAKAMAHKLRLATEHGAMTTWAKQTLLRQSDDTMTELVGNDRSIVVENLHRTETKHKEIHHQAATDHDHSAYQNFRTESGQNTELQTGRDLVLDVTDNATLTVKGSGGLFATVRNNEVFIQSAKAINIQGQGGGDITFEQAGGGFKVSSGGVVSFYGKKVFFGGSGGVTLNGKVNYSVPGPQPPGAVSTQAPLVFAGITPLQDPGSPQIINLAWAQDRIPVGEPIEGMFTAKNFQSGDSATISIYEYDANGQKDLVDTLNTTIPDDGTGHYTFTWTRTAQQASQDQQDDEAAGDTGPVEYRFSVDINAITAIESSNHLWLTKTVVINASEEENKTINDGTEIVCKMADGTRQYQVFENKKVTFTDVLVGPIEFYLQE